MNFSKKYILQAISVASNNLRLSSDKIETVAILRDHIQHCENLEESISKMKAKTELSKFAIKLWDAFQYTKSSNVDFLRISEFFKEHSHNLVMELSNLLDVATPATLNEILNSMADQEEISVELSSNSFNSELLDKIPFNGVEVLEEKPSKESVERDELKEELIFGGIKKENNFDFDDFEEEILEPITILENLLKSLSEGDIDGNELIPSIRIMKKNAEFSKEIGFTILADMHVIFYTTLLYVRDKKIIVDKNLIESLRACLIVIVAVVRGKDVDITNYLNKAENLGKYLNLE
jgi:hypothetical protein